MTTQPAAFSDRQRQGIATLVHNARMFERSNDVATDGGQQAFLRASAIVALHHDLTQFDAAYLMQALLPRHYYRAVDQVFADVYSRA